MLQLSMSHAPMLHMFIMGALIHSHGALGFRAGEYITSKVFRFRAGAEIVRHMSIAMRDPEEACKDVNILPISTLAHNDLFEGLDAPSKIPKQGPLRNLQLMNSCGSTESVPIHVDGLWNLIQLKGGLGKIETPGIASHCKSADAS